jgi:hypothetical protein
MNPPGRPEVAQRGDLSETAVPQTPDRPGLRRLGWALWPAFLAAAVLEMAVFALVDPDALHSPGGGPLALSRTAIYSLAFLGFWATTAAAAAVALWLADGQGKAPERWPQA